MRSRTLAWIVLYPDQGTTLNDLSDLGLGGVAQTPLIRERADLYATKFIARLTNRKTGQPGQPIPDPAKQRSAGGGE